MARSSTPALLLGLALASSGCYATAGASTDVDYVQAEYVPAHVEVYPHYVYGGRTVYLVDDRWYYRSGPRWVYYRREPAELYRRRVHVVQAPPAPPRRVHVAPPRHEPRRHVAPPSAPMRHDARRHHAHPGHGRD